MRPALRAVCANGLTVAALGIGAAGAAAQNPAWTATLIVQPSPSPFLADWNRNPTIAVLTVLYTGRGGQSFRVEAYARNASGEIGRVISPTYTFAFGPSTQLITASDVLNWDTERSNQTYVNLVERTGRLPEGPLQLCVRVLTTGGSQLTQTCTSVTVALPAAPQLIYPANQGTAGELQPVFQWTPVTVPPEVGVTYHLRVAEVRTQQTVRTALSANIPVFDGQVGGAPMFTYPLNALPLETGKQYAWQVVAEDQTGLPIARNQGASQMWTFTVGGPGRPPPLVAGAFPDTLTVVPGVARLSGLARVTVTQTPFAYVLDGQATLSVLAPFQGRMQVSLQGLQVDRTTRAVTGGSLSGTLASAFLPAAYGNPFVTFTRLAYDPTAGFTLSGALALPGLSAPLTGGVQLTASGLSGRLEATAAAGSLLGTLGADPAALRVQSAALSWPGGTLTLGGALDLFGQDVGCDAVTGTVSAQGALAASVACRPSAPVALVPGVTRLQLGLTAVSGSFGADLAGGTTTYQLTASGQVALDAGGTACGGSLAITLENGAVTPGSFSPSCDPSQASADLGWLAARLSNLRVQRLAYQPGQGFDFGLQVDLAPWIPAAAAIELPAATSVVVDRAGLSVPATSVTVAAGPIAVAGFGLSITRVALPAFTLAWSDWQAHTATGFAFSVDGRVSYTGPAATVPACLAGASLALAGATLASGQLAATVANQDFTPACSIPLGGGAAFQLQSIGGSVGVALSPALAVTASPSVSGALLLPGWFACTSAGDRTLALPTTLTLTPPAVLTGHVSGLMPACPLDLAAVQVSLTGAALDLAATGAGVQSAVLDGGASARFTSGTGTVTGTGSVAIDLIAGRLTSGRLAFQGPFELDLPRTPALLAFVVSGAVLDSAGLTVDGRAKLAIGQDSIGATFDNVTLNPQTAAVTAGRILFDAPFALQLGVAGDGSLTWSALAAGAALTTTSGVRLDLPTQLALDSAGLTASGTATGHLVLDGRDLDSLSVTFSSDFGLAVAPPSVASGSASIAWHGAVVATLDRQGFHPNLGALASQVVPDKLGLPSASVAYLQLKDASGNLLVATQQTSGGVRVYTPPGVTVPLVAPALQLGRSAAPQLNVSLDVTVDPLGGGITAGTIGARVPAGTAGFDLSAAGLPFAVDSIAFAASANAAATLSLLGEMALFGQRLAGSAPVALQLDATGNLTGGVSVTAAAPDSIPLVPGFGGLALLISSVTGSFNASLLTGALKFDLSAAAALAVGSPGGAGYRASATVAVTDQGVAVSKLDLPTGADSLGVVDLGVVRLALSGLQVPTLSYNAATGTWSFDFVFNAGLQFPQLDSLTLPTVEGVELTPQGFKIPQLNLPQLGLSPVSVLGFVVSPLAFRTARAITFNWFAGQAPSDWGFGFDLSLGFGQSAPPALRNLTLTVLNAGLSGGVFTGTAEPLRLASPLATAWGAIDSLGGSLSALQQAAGSGTRTLQGIGVTVSGHFGYPALLRCGAAPADTAAAITVGIDATGALSGTVANVIPRCPVQLGPLAVRVSGSSLTFGVDPTTGSQRAELDGTALLKVPAPTAPDSASATGLLGVDLIAGRIVSGSLTLNQPFRVSLPSSQPFLTFDVTSGRIDTTGFLLSGTGALVLDAGDSVTASLNNLLLRLPDLSIRSGSVSFAGGFSFVVGLSGSTLTWAAGKATAAPPVSSGLVVTTPDTVSIGPAGLRLGGRATAALAFNGTTYDETQLAVSFDSGFAIGLSPVRVSAGRAALIHGADTVAYVNVNGFEPGNVLGLLPIPDSIPLPTYGVAYVRLKDVAGNTLVTTSPVSGGMQLATKPGGVPLIVPSLAAPGQSPPTVNVTCQFVIAQTQAGWSVVSDSIAAVPANGKDSLFDLTKLGLPLNVTRLAYAARSGTWGLHLDASVLLPASLASAPLVFKDLTVGPQGLSGTADLGTYSVTPSAGAPVIASATVGAGNSVQFTGAHAVFGGSSQSIAVSGQVLAGLFSAGSGQAPSPIYFTGTVTSAGAFTAAVNSSSLPPLSIGAASFTPQSVGSSPAVGISASTSAFTVTLSGVLGLSGLGSQFGVMIGGLSIGTAGVGISSLALSGGTSQQISLFGQTLTLKDEGQCQAVNASYAAPVLKVSLSGELSFLGNTSTFCNLTVGTDGSVSIAQASLLSSPATIVANTLTLDTLSIVTVAGHGPTLHADLAVAPPAPLGGSTPDHAAISVSADGTVTGGTTITVLQPGTVQPVTVGTATVALQKVALALDFSNLKANSQVQVWAAMCLQANASSCGATGGGPAVVLGTLSDATKPGVTVGFDGTVKVPNIGIVNGPITLSATFIQLGINSVQGSVDASGGGLPKVSLTIGGSFGVSLPAVTSDITFTGFQVSSAGQVNFSAAGISNGSFSVAGIVALSVSKPVISTTPTTIWVPSGSAPSASSGTTKPDSTQVTADFYLSFGGSVDIGGGAFSAGVRKVLFYHTTTNETHFLVDSAGFAIPGVVAMQAELKYDQKDANNWNILVGGSANAIVLGNAGLILVGDVGATNGQPVVGIFVAANGLQITLAPTPVTITGLGGGFFLNPPADAIALVKSLCGVQGPDQNKVAAAPAKVAVMLYAAVGIVSEAVINGQVLLTVTNQEFDIDGKVTVFAALQGAGATLEGDAHLAIQFGHFAVTGAVDVTVNVLNVVSGNGSIAFALYDANTWSINGAFNAQVFGLFNASGSLAISPAGFLLDGQIAGTYTILIASVTGGFGAQVWYLPGGNWGGYVTASLSAQVLGGALSATGTITGALINAPGKGLMVFASGDLKASALGASWEGTVWVQFVGGQASAGFGDDPTMDQAIAAAENEANSLNQQTQAIQQSIAAAQVQANQISIPVTELAAAYSRIVNFSQLQQIVAVALPEFDYIQSLPAGTDTSYFSAYNTILYQSDAPGDTAIVRQLGDSVSNGLARAQGMVAGLQTALGGMQVQTTQLAQSPPPAIPKASPISASTLTSDSGKVVSFRVDAAVAAQATSAAQQGVTQAAAYESAVRQQATALEVGLATVRATMSDTGGSSFLTFVNRYDRVEAAAEEQFARQVNFLLERKAWAQSKDSWLQGRAQQAQQVLSAAGSSLAAGNQCRALRSLDEVLASALSGWTGDQSYINNLKSDEVNTPYGCDPLYVQHAHDYATALFETTGDAGLQAMAKAADSIYQVVSQNAATRLAAMRAVQGTVTQEYNGVAQSEAALAGALHDLYARYADWKTAPASSSTSTTIGATALGGSSLAAGLTTAATTSTGAATSSSSATGAATGAVSSGTLASGIGGLTSTATKVGATSLTTTGVTGTSTTLQALALVPNFDDVNSVKARMTQLATELTVPTVTSVQVVPILTTPFMVKLQVSWSGTHPDGIYEYEWADAAGSSATLASTFWSSGTSGSHTLSLFTPSSTSGGTASRTVEAAVRGGAGYVGYKRDDYTITFDPTMGTPCNGCNGASLSSVSSTVPSDNTPPGAPGVSVAGPQATVNGVVRVWSTDPTHIDAAWTAVDRESGISEYDYAVVSGNPPWNPTSWTSVGGRTNVTLDQLRLSASTPVTILARAKNGQGLTGPNGMSQPIYYDSVPPAWPVLAALTRSGSTAPTSGAAASVAACAVSAPSFPAPASTGGGLVTLSTAGTQAATSGVAWAGALASLTPTSGLAPGAAIPTITFKLPAATDAVSGVRDYWYHVDQAAGVPFDSTQWIRLPANSAAFTVTGDSFDYAHQYHVAVVARNWSDLVSSPLAYGPFVMPDPTAPSTPGFCAGMSQTPGVLAVQLATPSTDLESGVRGYQYWVHDAAAKTALPAFPVSSDSLDWQPVSANSTLRTRMASLIGGHSYLVSVRAINGQGAASNYGTSGPFVYDTTPPPAPGVTASVDSLGIAVKVNVGADPESGLMGLQVAVGKTASGTDVVAWQEIANVAAGLSTIHVKPAGLLPVGTYYVRVREVNGVGWPGATSTATFTIAPIVPTTKLAATGTLVVP